MFIANHQEHKLLLLDQERQQLEQELAERYAQLGREVYESVERSVGEIGRVVDRLVELRIEACALGGTAPCPHCLTENPLDSLYCCHCGGKLPPTKEEES